MIKSEIGLCLWRNRNWRWRAGTARVRTRTQSSIPGSRRRHSRYRRNPQGLPDRLKVCEEERFILQDRSANRSPKLISLEGWNVPHIEVVLGVQRAVAKKLVSTAVNLIRADRVIALTTPPEVLPYSAE